MNKKPVSKKDPVLGGDMKTIITLCLVLVLIGCSPFPTRSPSPTPPAATSSPSRQPETTNTRAERFRAIYKTITPSACTVANTKGEVLNIRKAPSLQAEIIGGLVPGQRVTVLIYGEPWQKIQAGQLTGYIYSKYCEVTQ